MYSFKSKVRYSEIDQNGKLTLDAILNYLQDASTFQSEELGLGIKYLQDEKMAWVLNYWQVDVVRYPKMAEQIEIGTFPYEFKKFIGFRNFFIKDESGEMIVKANSIWTLIDLTNARPIKPPQGMLDGYALEPRLDMEYLERKVSLKADESASGKENSERTEETVLVRKHNIDTNNHVNNAQYVAIAMDYLKEDEAVTRLRAEYKKSAVLGDVIVPSISENETEKLVSLRDSAGEIYANILFNKG